MQKKWQISRRRMLKGMGACVALPFLEAMAFGGSGSSYRKPPVRNAFLYMPNGIHPDHWTPATMGREFEFTRQLLPLKDYRNDIQVLGELMNHRSIFKGADGHYAKSASLLTCQSITQTIGDNINSNGVSVDQIIANHVGDQTLFPSLEYGLDRITTGVDINVGFTRLYGSAISWKTPLQPMSKEIDPRLAFDRLFRTFIPGRQPKNDPYKQSILDAVMDDAKSLKNNLGRSDQDKLSEYLESIYSVEKRISNTQNLEKFASRITPDIKKELIRVNQNIDEYVEMYAGVDVTEKTRLMFDIMTLAFWSDASRVSTFMFGNSVSNRNFTFIDGVHGNHHSISHHMNKPETLEEYLRISAWHIEQYAYLIGRLKSIKEGDSTLLDNSMIMFMSDLRDGNRHAPQNLPIVLAGKGGGKLKTGQNIVFPKETNLANLYLTMLHAQDINVPQFADSNRTLSEILV
ncbi:MAG: DUF1552 domain-containing protein [Chitinophagaceae bacterium]|nr:DUF1552 domain-containing protein [Chitinophagaceae bacterium]